MSSRRILVGVFGAAHGVRGELRLKSYTEQPAAIAQYGVLSSEDGRQSFTLETARILKDDLLVVRVKGVQDRSEAERLTNARLYVERARLPVAEPDEFYHADLVGLRAEDHSGQFVGKIVALHNFGAGDLLEVAPSEGETILVPFTKAFVPVVDIQGGRVVFAENALTPDNDPLTPGG